QRLGVVLGGVRPAEADDDVGDAELLKASHAVGAVGVGRDHVDREWLGLGAVLGAQLGQPLQQTRQVGGVAAAVQPAVTVDGSPLQGGLVVPADQDGDGKARRRTHLYGGHVEDLPVEFEEAPGHQPAHDGDLLVHAPAPALPGHAADLVVLGPGAGADAEYEAVVGEHRGGADL